MLGKLVDKSTCFDLLVVKDAMKPRLSMAWWVAFTTAWVLAAIVAVIPAITSFMMFDAPGATENPLTVLLFFCALTSPAFCLAGAIVPWFFRSTRAGPWLFLLPFLNGVAFTIVLVALNVFCGGNFACGNH